MPKEQRTCFFLKGQRCPKCNHKMATDGKHHMWCPKPDCEESEVLKPLPSDEG